MYLYLKNNFKRRENDENIQYSLIFLRTFFRIKFRYKILNTHRNLGEDIFTYSVYLNLTVLFQFIRI